MTAVDKPLYIEQGATFRLGFTWHAEGPVVDGVVTPGQALNLNGCAARMQIRASQGSAILVSATSETTGDGADRIYLGDLTGRVVVTLTDEDTDLLAVSTAVYDLEVVWPLARVEQVSVTSGLIVVTGAAGMFMTSDIGGAVTGANIPANTTIVSIAANGSTATLSAAASGTSAAEEITITNAQPGDRPHVDRVLKGGVTVDPNLTQVGDEPIVV